MRIPRLLREPVFRRFWIGETISLFGDQVALIALPLAAVLVLDAGATEMGYLTAAALAPNLVFSLHAGAWVDRQANRRRLMIAADLGRAALAMSIPVAYALDALTIWQLYVVAFVTGAFTVLFFVSYNALFVSIVPREQYLEANSLLHGSRALSSVGGPSIGGILVQIVSAPFTLLIDALSFLASAFFLGSISPEEPPPETAARGHLAEGVRFIRRTPVLLASLCSTATINFFNFVFFALFVLYATRELDVGAGALGLVLGAAAVGSVLGSVITGRLSTRIGIGPAFIAGSLLFTAPLVLVPLAAGPKPVVLAFLFFAEFGSGLGVMILDISAGSIFQALVPDRLRARFSGAYMVVNNGVRPLGALAGGALGSAIGLRPTLWIATVGAIVGVLWLLPSPLPRLHALPDQAE